MLVISVLLEILVGKGVLTREESNKIGDLYSLQKALDGALDRLLTPHEKKYVNSVNRLLEERQFEEIEKLEVPTALIGFSENLLRLLPSLQSLSA